MKLTWRLKCALLLSLLVLSSLSVDARAERAQMTLIYGVNSANDMSPDGRYVVGQLKTGEGYLWDRVDDTWTTLPPQGQGGGFAPSAVSDDGSVIVGDIDNPDSTPENPLGNVAGLWRTGDTSWTSLGSLPNALNCPSRSDSYDVSADGSTVVGLSWDGCSGRGFRWTEATGMEQLQPLANGGNRASVVSADGTVIAGFAQGSFSRTPATWDGTTLTGELLDPPNGDALGEITGISDDGSVLLGIWNGDATRWTRNGSAWDRETIGNGSFSPAFSGYGVDIADTDRIVGFDSLIGNAIGWVYDEGNANVVLVENFVRDRGGDVPLIPVGDPNYPFGGGSPISAQFPSAISTDGHVFVGNTSFIGAWMVEVFSDCDFDGDFACDLDDIDALVAAIAGGSTDLLFDLTGDGQVTLADRDAWLVQAGAENLPSGGAYLVADANLDGFVDVSDFNIWNGNKFESTPAWSLGDFNADGSVDVSDFNLWNSNKFTASGGAAVVPEPGSLALLLLGMFALCGARRNVKRAL